MNSAFNAVLHFNKYTHCRQAMLFLQTYIGIMAEKRTGNQSGGVGGSDKGNPERGDTGTDHGKLNHYK